MPSQRETQKKALTLNAVAGVNQADRDVLLPPSEYSLIQGVFPEFAGLQSRLWGKRTLAKYTGSIYSIYQFWSPYGYGIGLYQFSTELDYGIWLTPTTEIETALLPAVTIPIDGGGFTVNAFGYGYGSNFGYSDPNVCGLTFSSTGTVETACIPEPAPVSVPDDRNGGPAGQGRRCQWTTVNTVLNFNTYAVSAKYGDTGAQDVVVGSGPPIVVPLPAIPVPTYTTQLGPPWDVYMIAHMERGSYQVGVDYHNNWRAYGGKVIFDFTALESDPSFVEVRMTMHEEVLTVGLTGNTRDVEVPISSGELDFTAYFTALPSIRDVSDGHQQLIQTYPTAIYAVHRQRVCA